MSDRHAFTALRAELVGQIPKWQKLKKLERLSPHNPEGLRWRAVVSDFDGPGVVDHVHCGPTPLSAALGASRAHNNGHRYKLEQL